MDSSNSTPASRAPARQRASLPRSRPWLARTAAWLPVMAIAAAAGARVLNLQVWPFELLWHFTEIFFYLSVVVTVFLLALSFYLPAAAAAALALFFAFAAHAVPGGPSPHVRSMLPSAEAHADDVAEATDARFRLVTHNLYIRNNRRADLAAWLRRQDADVIVMQEIDAEMAAVLEAARDRYPHQFVAWPRAWTERPELRSQLNGLAILSRHPLDRPSVFRQTRYEAPAAFAGLTLPNGAQVRLVVVHSANPLRRSGLRARNLLMRALAETLNDEPGRLVVAGDFNATPYTPAFADFLATARLTTTRRYPGTYPQFAGSFGLPIDHVLVRGVRIADIEALDAFGSDHRPLRADLVIPATTKPGG